MAPPKPPKKTPKSGPLIEKPIMKSKKTKKNYESFSIYLFKVLKSIAPEKGISRKSMLIMNNFIHDMLETIATEAGRLAAHSHKNTLGIRDMEAALKLVAPGELAKHAHIEGMKAIQLYHRSVNK